METVRLRLHPMTLEQLALARYNLPKVVEELGGRMTPFGFWETQAKRKIYAAKHDIIKYEPDAWLFATAWLIFDKKDMRLLGEAGFKGLPNERGAIEIGYSTRENERCKGIMTEAVGALIKFAFSQTRPRVEIITALTLPENIASHRVLQKNGFVYKPSHGKYWTWERSKR